MAPTLSRAPGLAPREPTDVAPSRPQGENPADVTAQRRIRGRRRRVPREWGTRRRALVDSRAGCLARWLSRALLARWLSRALLARWSSRALLARWSCRALLTRALARPLGEPREPAVQVLDRAGLDPQELFAD